MDSNPRTIGIYWLLFSLYKHYGPEVFKELSIRSWVDLHFAFLHHRLARKTQIIEVGKPKSSVDRILDLYSNFLRTRDGSRRRFLTSLYDDISMEKLHCTDLIGCEYQDCPGRSKMEALAKRSIDERMTWDDMSKEELQMIKEWGYQGGSRI